MGIRKILFPTNFSPKTYNSLQYLINISKKLNAEVYLYHTYRLPPTGAEVPYYLIEEQIEEISNEACAKLEELSGQLKSIAPGLKVDFFANPGIFEKEIKKVIQDREIDLVVMGTRGAGYFDTKVFSSNSSIVIERVDCPVLAIPKDVIYNNLKHIVYASEYLDSDLETLNFLSEIAQAFDAEITVLNIFENKTVTERVLTREFENMVHEAVLYDKIQFTYIKGHDVCDSLQHYLDNHSVDLFGMTTKHRNLFEKVINPSKTQRMLHQAHKPLIAFHTGK